jgi:hypothetical protein
MHACATHIPGSPRLNALNGQTVVKTCVLLVSSGYGPTQLLRLQPGPLPSPASPSTRGWTPRGLTHCGLLGTTRVPVTPTGVPPPRCCCAEEYLTRRHP